nr:Vps62-related protein [Actinomycetota bacterium]
VWRFAFTVSGSSLPILVGGKNSQTGRTDLRGAGHWLFFSYKGQDRGLARTGRHQGDWEFAQLRLSPAGTPDRLDLAQHSWAEGCGSRGFERRGPAPVIYVANDSHALYPRPGVAGRPWPDPNDEADGQGRVVRPPVTEVSESRRGGWPTAACGGAPARASRPGRSRVRPAHGSRRMAASADPPPTLSESLACGSTPPAVAWQAVLGGAGVFVMAAAVLFAARRRPGRQAT